MVSAGTFEMGKGARRLIKRIKVCDLKPLVENPPSRTSDKAVGELVEYIRCRMSAGKSPLAPQDRLLIGCDGILGDGHRRRAALLICGVDEVEVEFDTERTAREIWRDRACAKSLTSIQIVESAALGLSEEYFPKQQRKNANRITQLAGEKGLKLVLNSSASFGVHQSLSRIVSYIGVTGDQDYGYKVLDWLIRHKMQLLSRLAIQSGKVSVAKLKNCIEKNKPLQIG